MGQHTHTVHGTRHESFLRVSVVHRGRSSKIYSERNDDMLARVVEHDRLASGLQKGIPRFCHALGFYRRAYHFLRSGLVEAPRVALVVGKSARRLPRGEARGRRPRRARLARAARARAGGRDRRRRA